MEQWYIYQGNSQPNAGISSLPSPPAWRPYRAPAQPGLPLDLVSKNERGAFYIASEEEIKLVNAALYLRRPLLITGKPGSGKSSLAYAVAYELKLGSVLLWPITSRTTLQDGLYNYDAIARLQDANFKREAVTPPDLGKYIKLGSLGTALLPYPHPRVLLIDEIDKSDLDLPNDLLNIFEEGEFEIPELVRAAEEERQSEVLVRYQGSTGSKDVVPIIQGMVRSHAFPFVVLTSNGEREFPPAFLRRCIRLELEPPDDKKLAQIVERQFGSQLAASKEISTLISEFVQRRDKNKQELATDQLLNALYLVTQGANKELLDRVLRPLNS